MNKTIKMSRQLLKECASWAHQDIGCFGKGGKALVKVSLFWRGAGKGFFPKQKLYIHCLKSFSHHLGRSTKSRQRMPFLPPIFICSALYTFELYVLGETRIVFHMPFATMQINAHRIYEIKKPHFLNQSLDEIPQLKKYRQIKESIFSHSPSMLSSSSN